MKFREFYEDYQYYLNEKEYWGSVGAGIIPFAQDTQRFLLSLRSADVNEPNTWGVIGGKLDEHENNPMQAAVREFKEEIGLQIDENNLELIYVYNSPEKENGESVFKYYTFVGYISKEIPELETKQYGWETERCKWFSLEEIYKIKNLHFGVKELLKHNALEKIQN